MSILDRLLGGESNDDESCCDMQIEEVDSDERLAVVHALREGELCACELETVLDAPQSTVASHLRKLRDAGIVATRKEGKWTYYRIADTASLQLLDLAAALGEDR